MTEITELCGIIPVNKPDGWTSFDVVAKLRGILKIKRLGHAGTLDPMATGVLPVFVGKATKACDIIPEEFKAYKAGFKLGICTDTLDITGKILSESDTAVSRKQLEEAVKGFTGDIMQIPPMYSAVKVDGKKLYELARQGKTVERKPRSVRVESIEILDYSEEDRSGELLVKCSKGTYVRTLIEDIGNRLEAGGAMTSLVRTASGGFTLEECFTVEEIAKAVSEERLRELLKPIESIFSCYKSIRLDKKHSALYRNGVKLRCGQCSIERNDGIYRVYGSVGEFIGLAVADGTSDEVRVYKNF